MAIAPKSVINYLVCTLFYLQPWVRKNQDIDGDSFKKCHKLFGLYIVLLADFDGDSSKKCHKLFLMCSVLLAALGEKEPRL